MVGTAAAEGDSRGTPGTEARTPGERRSLQCVLAMRPGSMWLHLPGGLVQTSDSPVERVLLLFSFRRQGNEGGNHMVTCHGHIYSTQLAGVASTGLLDFKTQADAHLNVPILLPEGSAFFLLLLLFFLPFQSPGTLEGSARGIFPFCRFGK